MARAFIPEGHRLYRLQGNPQSLNYDTGNERCRHCGVEGAGLCSGNTHNPCHAHSHISNAGESAPHLQAEGETDNFKLAERLVSGLDRARLGAVLDMYPRGAGQRRGLHVPEGPGDYLHGRAGVWL